MEDEWSVRSRGPEDSNWEFLEECEVDTELLEESGEVEEEYPGSNVEDSPEIF